MALSCCSSSAVAALGLLALLLLPGPALFPGSEPAPPPPPPPAAARLLHYCPPLDLALSGTLALCGLLTYLAEWVQRKLMERRIMKLNSYLQSSVEKLRAWDAQQEQLESSVRLAQEAATEYNLLLYLLLRQHRAGDPRAMEHRATDHRATDHRATDHRKEHKLEHLYSRDHRIDA
ncbi:unnamed protein product [Plutella xylostella]|uniref:(diamondback moth) hypothetical protein n=1 Tax=Plutella xylostella TaxID=51655 RepID=A0A8S4GAS6_PLUXY|nr:unnamed protein product [Plutella xylostella]